MHVVPPIIATAAITSPAACEINPHHHAVRPLGRSHPSTRDQRCAITKMVRCDALQEQLSLCGYTSRMRFICRMVTSRDPRRVGSWRDGRTSSANLADDLPYDGVELFVATAAGRRCVRAEVQCAPCSPQSRRGVVERRLSALSGMLIRSRDILTRATRVVSGDEIRS